MSGFIQIHRKITEWEWYDDANTFRLFMHLLLKANYKAKSYRGMQLEAGTILTGRDLLAKELKMSVQQIRTALSKLELTGEVTIESSSQGTKIQLIKYKEYQMPTSEQPTSNQPVTNEQPTSNQRVTTNNKDNKDNKENKENKKEEGFDFLKSIIDLGVEEQVAKDWMVVRKKKGASNTPTAFNRIKKEIEACSATPNECITLVAENSWRGFEARYFTDNNASSSKQEEISADEKALAENWKIINGGTYIWRGLTKTKTWTSDYELKDLPDNNKIEI